MQIAEAKVLAARVKVIPKVTVLGVRASGKGEGDKALILRLGRRELRVTNASSHDAVVGKLARIAGVKSGGWITLGVCPLCSHALKAQDGHFHETKVEYGKVAYAQPLCCRCLRKSGGVCSVNKS